MATWTYYDPRTGKTSNSSVNTPTGKPGTISYESYLRGNNPLSNVVIPEFAPKKVSPTVSAQGKAVNVAKAKTTTTSTKTKTKTTTPTKTATEVPVTEPPVGGGDSGTTGPVDVTPTPWDVYTDPNYLLNLMRGQSAFNSARIDALANKERQTLENEQALQARVPAAEEARRRLAGNFAARGMGGGRYGALTRAEAQQNASELAARTSLRDQISELNRQFVANYGAEGSDWLGTRYGSEAQQAAIQAAIDARLNGLTGVR